MNEDNNTMTLNRQAILEPASGDQHPGSSSLIESLPSADDPVQPEQQYRASAYGLIARLLREPPSQQVLDRVAGLSATTQAEGDQLMLAMSALGLSAGMHRPEAIDDEFHELFIGLGKGEVVPYGSWYLTGFLMEKPLSDLRDDLALLGYQRTSDTTEPEDHTAALCEVLALMIEEGTAIDRQSAFFETHIAPWVGRFFSDLENAKSAVFYKSVARFGAAFIAFDHEYLSMQT